MAYIYMDMPYIYTHIYIHTHTYIYYILHFAHIIHFNFSKNLDFKCPHHKKEMLMTITWHGRGVCYCYTGNHTAIVNGENQHIYTSYSHTIRRQLYLSFLRKEKSRSPITIKSWNQEIVCLRSDSDQNQWLPRPVQSLSWLSWIHLTLSVSLPYPV